MLQVLTFTIKKIQSPDIFNERKPEQKPIAHWMQSRPTLRVLEHGAETQYKNRLSVPDSALPSKAEGKHVANHLVMVLLVVVL